MQRGLDSQGISRGVKNTEVFAAASRDGSTAAREMPCEARPPGRAVSEFVNDVG